MKRGLGKNRSGLIAALDVGSTKVCCFIAQPDGERPPKVIGIGQQASRGIKSGMVVDIDEVEAAIVNAVHAAEQMAGTTICQVLVNLSSGQPTSSSVAIEVPVQGGEIGEADIRRAIAHCHQAQALNGPGLQDAANRELIHSIPIGYSVDGTRGIRDPRGMYGRQLGANLHMVTAARSAVRNLRTSVERCHLDVGDFVASPYAAGLACLVEDELDLGVTLIDMGGGTTSIAVFYEHNVIYCDVLPIGGQHVTNDIARGLSTPVSHAERMKTLYGHAVAAAADERHMIDVTLVGEEEPDQHQQVPRSILVGIIQPRLEETFELVRARLEMSGFDKIAGRRVVLTGGASQLAGAADLAAQILDKQVRLGRPTRIRGLAEATGGPAYSACAGLLLYALEVELPATAVSQGTPETAGFVGRFGNWIREHF